MEVVEEEEVEEDPEPAEEKKRLVVGQQGPVPVLPPVVSHPDPLPVHSEVLGWS